jgi:N-alpha-acetyl-L-2,4-diaminobutyrate deacetylase
MSASITPISATVDFDKDGIQHGHLVLPHSHDESAWGSIMIPVCVVKNGSGPTVLMTGANHGDEYEGPVALWDLARTIDPQQVSGRVIIVPAMNYPAFRVGRRTSPIDGGNMNRSFPGNSDGGPTAKIAHYFMSALLPLADIVVDLHSGGRTLDFLPFAAAHVLPNKAQEKACVEAMMAFCAPYAVMLLELDAVSTYDTAAESLGKVFVTTELSGGGTSSAETASIAKRGVTNLLRHAGVLPGAVEGPQSQRLDMPDGRCYTPAQATGLVEWLKDLGDEVKAGEVIARVHDVERTGSMPVDHVAGVDGLFMGRHFPGIIRFGDTLGVIGVTVD